MASVKAFSDSAIRNNFLAVEYCKTFVSALSGSCAGIIGLTGIIGFIFYFISVIVLWFMVLFKAGSGDKWRRYFRQRDILLTNGIFDGLFTYVLFWTFLYGMVHVY